MNPRQVALIRSSWSKVLPISDKAAEMFYGKLFELDPQLRQIFKSDMKMQGRKLMSMISIAVNSLDNLPDLIPVIEDMGRRHTLYGVREKDYKTVGVALIWTLEAGLEEAFTSEVRMAWIEMYSTLSGVMLNAAEMHAIGSEKIA